jgi:hypothetical protein
VNALGSRRCRLFRGSGLNGLASTVAAVFAFGLPLELPLYRFVCFLERVFVLGNGGIVLDDLRQSATVRSLLTVTGLICTTAHVRELSNYLLMLIEHRFLP